MILITLMGIAVNWSFLIIPDKIRLLKPQSISISKLRKKLGTNNNKEKISWPWIKKDLKIIEEHQIFSTGHLQKKSSRTIPVFLPEMIVGYTVTKVWIDIYCPSKASDPSTKCQTFSAKFKDSIQEGKPLILGTFFDIPYCERKKME